MELILLGRTLMKIGEQALPPAAPDAPRGGERTVVVVMSDVYQHPETSVVEVARRTGLPQSAVSTAVARLREVGSIVAEPDPSDRRRQLLRRNPELTARRREVATARIDEALATALDEPAQLGAVLAALEILGQHLTPEAIARLRPQ